MRALDLSSRRFRRELDALAPAGTPRRSAIALALRRLADDAVLPGPNDQQLELPMLVLGRSVEGTNLVIAYAPLGDIIAILALLVAD